MKTLYPDNLCDCNCGNPCPFDKTGMAYRCDIPSLLSHFQCQIDELPNKLTQFRKEKSEELEKNRVPMHVTLVCAPRPE